MHVCSIIETRQSKATMPKDNSSFFSKEKKEELPQAGFEPATFCALGSRSTCTCISKVGATQPQGEGCGVFLLWGVEIE